MFRIATALALLATLCGCHRPPALAQVSGVVLLDGSPLAEVVVEFLPDPDQQSHGPRSTGTTDAQGRFQLVCDDGRPGAAIGTHRVLVQDPRSFPPPRLPPGAPAVVSPPRVDEKYRKATDTPLRQEIQPGEKTVTIAITAHP